MMRTTNQQESPPKSIIARKNRNARKVVSKRTIKRKEARQPISKKVAARPSRRSRDTFKRSRPTKRQAFTTQSKPARQSKRVRQAKHKPVRPIRAGRTKARQALGRLQRRAPASLDALSFVVQGLDTWRNDYLACLGRFQKSSSAGNVHDLRVAIRRLSTVLDLIDRFSPDNIVRRARARIEEQRSALSLLRDAHVEMVRMRRFLKELPEMKPFYDDLLRRESRNLRAAKKLNWKTDGKFIETAFNRAMLRLNARRASSSDESTRKIIEASIDVLFDNLSKKLERVIQTDYASIHRVRLAFKPLRYTLELLQPLLGVDRAKLKSAAVLARLMGQIQDLEVLMKDLVESNWRKENALSAIVEIWLELERQKEEATRRFFKAIPKFGTIWKPIIYDQSRVSPPRSKTLLILRHGIAVARGDPAYPLDSDRPLTNKGLKRMRRIADGMRRLHVGFELILSSPYKRALETAFAVARDYRAGQSVQSLHALKAEVLPEEVIRALMDKYTSFNRILLVGHEPQLSALVSTLTSGNASARPLLKKGGLCRLQIDRLEQGKCATLVWLLTPRQLLNIG